MNSGVTPHGSCGSTLLNAAINCSVMDTGLLQELLAAKALTYNEQQ
jgi:hypothetical protein